MRIYETRERVVKERILVSQTCDICHEAAHPVKEWAASSFDVNETSVQCVATAGARYPEGGSVTETIFDICPDCFHKFLAPFLKSKGAAPITKETDF